MHSCVFQNSLLAWRLLLLCILPTLACFPLQLRLPSYCEGGWRPSSWPGASTCDLLFLVLWLRAVHYISNAVNLFLLLLYCTFLAQLWMQCVNSLHARLSDKQNDFEEKMGEIACSIGSKSSMKSVVGEISKFDILFIVQKLKSKHTPLKKYLNCCLSLYIFWGNERKYFPHISGIN